MMVLFLSIMTGAAVDNGIVADENLLPIEADLRKAASMIADEIINKNLAYYNFKINNNCDHLIKVFIDRLNKDLRERKDQKARKFVQINNKIIVEIKTNEAAVIVFSNQELPEQVSVHIEVTDKYYSIKCKVRGVDVNITENDKKDGPGISRCLGLTKNIIDDSDNANKSQDEIVLESRRDSKKTNAKYNNYIDSWKDITLKRDGCEGLITVNMYVNGQKAELLTKFRSDDEKFPEFYPVKPLKDKDTYFISVRNDRKYDIAVTLLIDGKDSKYSTECEQLKNARYIVKNNNGGGNSNECLIKGWLKSFNEETKTSETKEFSVGKWGKDEEYNFGPDLRLSTIQVIYSACHEKGKARPPCYPPDYLSNGLKTIEGKAVIEKIKLEPYVFQGHPIGKVVIRYDNYPGLHQ